MDLLADIGAAEISEPPASAPPASASPAARLTAAEARRVALAGFGLYAAAAVLFCWAVVQLTPDHVAIAAFGRRFEAADLHRRFLGRVMLLGLVLPAIFAGELAIVGWADSSLRRLTSRRTPSSMTDLACFVVWQTPLMSALIMVTSLGVALISGDWLHDRLAAMIGASPAPSTLPIAAQVLIYFLLYSFLDYWGHRLDHSRWFWPLHRYHHAADDFCVLSAVRSHPAVFTGVLSAALPVAIFRPSPAVIADTALFVVALRYVIHSQIRSDFGWVGRWVIQSPAHHRLHHVLEMTTPAGHFAIAPIWDHLFGTWRGGVAAKPAIGVDTPYRQGAWIGPDWWRDYADFWREIARFR